MKSSYIFILLIATGVLILTAAMMGLLIGLVLPRSMLYEEIDETENKDLKAIPEELVKRNLYRTYGNIDDYNWLVSINFLRYRDIPTSLEFFCSGVIVTRNKVLTGNGCFIETFNVEDFKFATIRSHSNHFSNGGYTHSVRNIQKTKDNLKSPYSHIYLVEVKPSFNSKTNIPILITNFGTILALEAMSEGGALVSTGWGGTQIPTEHILKYEPFFVQNWHPGEYVNCKGKICSEAVNVSNTCCKMALLTDSVEETTRVNTRPLVAIRTLGPPLLIGMQMEQGPPLNFDSVNYFIDFGYRHFVEWLIEILPDVIVEDTTNTQHDYEKLTIYQKIDVEAYHAEKIIYDTRKKSKK